MRVSICVLLSVFLWNSSTQIVEASLQTQQDLHRRLFVQRPKIQPPKGTYNQRQIQKWRKRYNGMDPNYDARVNKYRKRRGYKLTTLKKEITKGWQRFAATGDWQTVYQICLRNKVPFELVYLALAESHWKNIKSRRGAAGRWQFMPRTARAMGLKVNKSRDDRNNLQRSTRAAIKYLLHLRQLTREWGNYRISDNDRWLWAFWAYNRGPGKVKGYYKRLRGNPTNYARTISRVNRENSNYVNKIFGIRLALKDILSGSIQESAASASPLPPAPTRTQTGGSSKITKADLLYEEFLKNRTKLTPVQQLVALETIIDAYESDLKYKRHKKTYVYSAIKVVEKELSKIDDEQIQTEADKLYKQYVKNESRLSPGKKLQTLEMIKEKYEADLKKGRHSKSWISATLEAIEDEMSDIKADNKKAFVHKRNYAVKRNGGQSNIETTVDVDEKGNELIATVRKNGKAIDVDIVNYTILPGDRINDIALRLSGDRNNKNIVKQLIVDLNPEIENLNQIHRGQVIKVPGQYIEVPRKRLSQILKEYYPNQSPANAEPFLKFLNGLRKNQTIRPGDTILVPVL